MNKRRKKMSLIELRKKIDRLDSKIVELLNDRANLSKAIGDQKLKAQKGIYAPARQKKIYQRIKQLNQGPLSLEALRAIYREIMSCSLAIEKPLKIAFLGTQGSFTHMAATRKFGSQVNYVSSD